MIAEEVAQLDPRLVTWTYLPEDYETITTEISGLNSTKTELKKSAQPIPDGVQYDRLTVFLIKAVQDLKTENNSLKARITQLETT